MPEREDKSIWPPEPPAEPTAGEKLQVGLYRLAQRQNRPARMAFLLALGAVIPLLGIPLGIAAIVCGTLGLRKAAVSPQAGGRGEAILGITFASIVLVVHIFIAAAILLDDVLGLGL